MYFVHHNVHADNRQNCCEKNYKLKSFSMGNVIAVKTAKIA